MAAGTLKAKKVKYLQSSKREWDKFKRDIIQQHQKENKDVM